MTEHNEEIKKVKDEIIKNRKSFWESQWAQEDFNPIWANRACPIEIQNAHENKKLPHDGYVLDVGCGLGEIASWFSLNNFQVDAFDISEAAIQKAKKKYGNEKINFFTHDLSEAPLRKKYDVIVDRGCFHQIPLKLKEEFSRNLSESSNSNSQFFLFIKAFRGDINLNREDEAKMHFAHINKYFSFAFKINQCRVTDLSRDSTKNKMPGLFFHLTKI